MFLGGLQKITLIDFPGKVACTVFTVGCNFRCPFCYNPELVLPEEIKKQREIPEKKFFDFLKERKGLLQGVVICGGEPTLQKDLPEFLEKIKEMGFLIKLDTNGSNPEMLQKLLDKKLVDYVAMDIKAPIGLKSQTPNPKSQTNPKYKIQNTKYCDATGVKADLEKIKRSVEIIKNFGVDYEFRSTIVPTIHSKEDILQMAKEIAPAKKYFLQNFRPGKTIDKNFEKIKPYSEEFFKEVLEEIYPFFEVCRVR